MSKIISKTTILVMLAIFILSAAQAFAQQTSEYTVLAPLPGTTEAHCDPGTPDDPACKTTLQTYLPGIFNLAIGLSAVFAVLMIVIGGFQYISSDAIQGKNAGRERIKNAVLGLVLVISAWLILYTINPNLLTLNLNIEPATISPSAEERASSLQPTTIAARDALMAACPSCVAVTSTTGGVHSENSAHYQGRAIDIAPNADLNNYLTGSRNNPTPCQVVTRSLGGTSARFLWEPTGSRCGGTVPSSGDHWHMSVPGGASSGW